MHLNVEVVTAIVLGHFMNPTLDHANKETNTIRRLVDMISLLRLWSVGSRFSHVREGCHFSKDVEDVRAPEVEKRQGELGQGAPFIPYQIVLLNFALWAPLNEYDDASLCLSLGPTRRPDL